MHLVGRWLPELLWQAGQLFEVVLHAWRKNEGVALLGCSQASMPFEIYWKVIAFQHSKGAQLYLDTVHEIQRSAGQYIVHDNH